MGYLDELRAFVSENGADDPLTKPTKPGSVSFVSAPSGPFQRDATLVLRGWCSAIEALDPCEPRPGFSIGRWQTLFDASVWFLESFGRQAAIDGWQTGDLFGILPQVEGGGGLVDRLGHHRGLVLADGEARWRHMGEVPQRYLRGWQPDLKAFWEIDLV